MDVVANRRELNQNPQSSREAPFNLVRPYVTSIIGYNEAMLYKWQELVSYLLKATKQFTYVVPTFMKSEYDKR